jgi:putative membrane protein
MKFLFWLLIAFVAIVLALFAASNREAVTLALWPLDLALQLPLYVAILGAFLIGFLFGGLVAWNAGRHRRREARRRRRRITALEHELAATQAQLPEAAASPPGAIAARG